MMGRQIKKLLSTMQIGDIKEFKVRGFVSKYPLEKWKNNTITPHILSKLSSSCPNLEAMEIRESHINFHQVKISDFPSTLKRLIFHGCQISLPRSPRLFQKIDDHLQLLEEIALEKCPWFETHDLVVFSKLPHLKRLILRGCESLKGCVPYGSIAARFGFKSLEYLDVRDTPISDSDIQCFNVTTTLREILMDCPVALRFDSESSPLEMSDDDDNETYEPKPMIEDDEEEEQPKHRLMPVHESDLETESESEDESDCSSDSEDGNSDGEDGAAKASGNDDAAGTPQAHCIRVILQNGRMINVNAERSNEQENPAQMRPNVRCVIGIINGRDAGDSCYNRIVASPLKHQKAPGNQPDGSNGSSGSNASNASDASNAQVAKASSNSNSNTDPSKKSPEQSKPNKNDSTSNGNTKSANANKDSSDQPGPSGLQSNQNDSTKASKSNQPETNEPSNDEAGPSNRNAGNAPNAPNVEHRQRLIIVQHRHHNSNDENGNMNRRISWEVRNVYPIGDAANRNERSIPTSLFSSNGYYITDRGMCSFGMPRRNVQEGIIWIRAELRPSDTLLERITVRNYIDVTDVTLRHLALCAPNLRYLDVTSTSVTLKGITTFLKEKPDCQVVSELLDT